MRLAIALVGSCAAAPAPAGEAGGEIALGPLAGFPDEAAAAAACPDGVVWADRRTGFYYPRFTPEYGTTPDGTYACYKQAKTANYWSLGGADALQSRADRRFPFDPDPICVWFKDKGGQWRCGRPGS